MKDRTLYFIYLFCMLIYIDDYIWGRGFNVRTRGHSLEPSTMATVYVGHI